MKRALFTLIAIAVVFEALGAPPVTASSATYVKKSGDTMTGTLRAPAFLLTDGGTVGGSGSAPVVVQQTSDLPLTASAPVPALSFTLAPGATRFLRCSGHMITGGGGGVLQLSLSAGGANYCSQHQYTGIAISGGAVTAGGVLWDCRTTSIGMTNVGSGANNFFAFTFDAYVWNPTGVAENFTVVQGSNSVTLFQGFTCFVYEA